MNELILIVGDHNVVRTALRERLEIAFSAYEIEDVATGEEAMTMVLRQSPRVVVLDIGLSATAQFEVARRIRAVQPETRIVAWTMYDWDSDQLDSIVSGIDAYVLKEDTQDRLLSVLEALLAAQPDVSPHQSTEGGDTITIP